MNWDYKHSSVYGQKVIRQQTSIQEIISVQISRGATKYKMRERDILNLGHLGKD